jgi:hypothetical protein
MLFGEVSVPEPFYSNNSQQLAGGHKYDECGLRKVNNDCGSGFDECGDGKRTHLKCLQVHNLPKKTDIVVPSKQYSSALDFISNIRPPGFKESTWSFLVRKNSPKL